MNALHAALAVGLCSAGCADANAQPRRDAGAALRWPPVLGVRPISESFRGDGGLPSAFLRRNRDRETDLVETLAGAFATSAVAPAPVSDAEAVGSISGPAQQGRFADPERLAGVAVPNARAWLTVAGGWVLRCLARVQLATPFDAPVRFTVARDGTVGGVAVEGVTEAARQCLVEGLAHARFGPIAQPTELVARYLYTVRGARTERATPGRGR